MTGSSDGLSALKAHLLKKAYNESLLGLSDVTTFVQKCYPSLEVKQVEVTVDHQSGEPWTKQWVIVCTPTYIALDSDSSQPIQPARMLFHANGA